ncbi:MAG: transporter permease [Conexibacter sp.]|nr:transporter permease [Conexibacter sp.]
MSLTPTSASPVPLGESKRAGVLERLPPLRVIGPLIILPVLVVVFAFLNSRFLTSQNLLNIVQQAAVLLVVAAAATFVILMGSIDLSVGSIITLCGVTGALLLKDHGQWALIFVPLIGLGAGAINGWLFAYAKLPSFLVTLGTLYAFNGLALFIVSGSSIPVAPGLGLGKILDGTVIGIPTIALWAVGITLVLMFVARSTRFGRYTYVVGGGESVARLSGVPIQRHKFKVFVLSGLLASVAGILLMFFLGGGDPDMGTSYLLPTIAAVVMGGTPLSGGVGGPHRTILGVLIITVLNNGMTLANVQPYLQVVIQGFVVVGAVALAMDRSRLREIK